MSLPGLRQQHSLRRAFRAFSRGLPPGAGKGLRALGIEEGDENGDVFSLGSGGFYTTVREGWRTVRTREDWKDMPRGTTLSGRILFGDCVYGRFTEATLPDGRRFPVCLELWDREGGRGSSSRRAARPPRPASWPFPI